MNKTVFLWLTLIVLCTASMKAQVRIGSANSPHTGAILDLSEAPAGTKLGLLLPRVILEGVETLQMGGSTANIDNSAKGMLVYNYAAAGSDTPVGIYVWNGEIWKPIALF